MMEKLQWYYMLNSERFGPVGQAELEGWLSSGQLPFDTFVWSQELTEWTMAGNVPAFAKLQPVHAGANVAATPVAASPAIAAPVAPAPAPAHAPVPAAVPSTVSPQFDANAGRMPALQASAPALQASAPAFQGETPSLPSAASPQAPSAASPQAPSASAPESEQLKNLIRQQAASTPRAANPVLVRNDHFYACYLNNAYRVLGLTGSAPQQELKKTIANIRRQAKVGKAYTSPVDLAWIGAQVSRDEKNLLDAETRLLNPETRIKERILWFHSLPQDFPTELSPEQAAHVAQNVFKSNDALARHDAAVLMQFAAIADGPEFEKSELWNQALSMWRAIQQDEAYWNALCELDDKLGYEPVCLGSDIFACRDKLIDFVTEPIKLLSKDALNNGNQQLFARAAALINTGSNASAEDTGAPHSDTSSEIAEEFHRLMNSFYGEIGKMLEGLDRNEKTYKANRQKNLDICGHCETIFDYEIQKLLDNAKAALHPASSDLIQLREGGATILEMMGGGYTWADDYVNAIRLLERAEDLAKDTAAEPKIA